MPAGLNLGMQVLRPHHDLLLERTEITHDNVLLCISCTVVRGHSLQTWSISVAEVQPETHLSLGELNTDWHQHLWHRSVLHPKYVLIGVFSNIQEVTV